AFPDIPVRSAHASSFRGLLGVHSHYGLHTRAVTVYRDTLSEGFSHFVASIAAPVASGWTVCRVGFAPPGKRRLVTAHGSSRPSANCPKNDAHDQLLAETTRASGERKSPMEPRRNQTSCGLSQLIIQHSPPFAGVGIDQRARV